MFIAALVIIAKTWKQPRCCSVSEWTNRYTQTMEYYSDIKREELPSHNKTWRKLKCLLLCERNQSEKVICCMFPTIWKAKLD